MSNQNTNNVMEEIIEKDDEMVDLFGNSSAAVSTDEENDFTVDENDCVIINE